MTDFSDQGVTEEVISVPEVHCGHCKDAIEGALQPMTGVANAEVSLEARAVRVAYDPELVSRDSIVRAIVDQGYEVPA